MSKTLEELGYEKIQDNSCLIRYVKFFELKPTRHIIFSFDKEICVCEENEEGFAVKRDYFSMEELKAIYKYCEDNKWI